MVNTYQKGQRSQNKARKFYESLGYEVEVVRYDKYRKIKDFFGLWDLICVSDSDIIFSQVKTNNRPGRKWIKKAEEWGPSGPFNFVKEYVVYKDYRKGVKPAIREEL